MGINLKKMMKQAQEMQAKLQEQMKELEVEASVGGEMVTVKMNGEKQIIALSVHPDVIDPDDIDTLQDLITAAVNEAARKVDEHLQMQLGGLGIPGF